MHISKIIFYKYALIIKVHSITLKIIELIYCTDKVWFNINLILNQTLSVQCIWRQLVS